MKKRSKKYLACLENIDKNKNYALKEAVEILKKNHYVKFDETVEIAMRLGVDPKHADQMVRGTVSLPFGLGKTVRVIVFTAGEKEKEAREAGADEVGGDDLIKKVQDGWLEFDAAIATPDIMGKVSKLGKLLGPRGLMPNPKTGTVTFDVGKAVKELKAGKIQFKVDKTGNMHAPIGKLSFPVENICENASTFVHAIVKAKPSTAKGQYIKSLTISTTMQPGLKLDLQEIIQAK